VRKQYDGWATHMALVDARSGEKLLSRELPKEAGVALSRDGSLIGVSSRNGHTGRWGGQVRVTDVMCDN